MVNILLYYVVLLSQNFLHTLGHEAMQPYGPNMCDVLCECTEDCIDYNFDDKQLSCHLNICEGCGKAIDKTRLDHGSPACPSVDVDALRQACKSGRLEAVQKLVCQGKVGVNCKGDDGTTAIMLSASKNQLEIFCFLFKEHADILAVADSGDNVLHYACTGGSLFIIMTLLGDKRIDIDCKNKAEGQTPLFNAVYYGNVAAVQLLKERGANFKVKTNVNETILHYACMGDDINMVRYVLSLETTNIESRGNNGRTPLITTVESGTLPIVKCLHQRGKASLTAKTDEGDNVLHAACSSNSMEMVEYLLSFNEVHGFERMKNNKGMTPIDVAKNSGFDKLRMYLESMKY